MVNRLKCVNFVRMYLVHKSVGFLGYVHHGNGFEASVYWMNPLGFSLSELTLRLLMSYIYIYMEHLFLMFVDRTR